MSSLAGAQALVLSGVTYNTLYMHQLNRKCIFAFVFNFLQLTISSTQITRPGSSPIWLGTTSRLVDNVPVQLY